MVLEVICCYYYRKNKVCPIKFKIASTSLVYGHSTFSDKSGFFFLADIVNVYLQNSLRIAKGKKMPNAEGIKNVVSMDRVTEKINLVWVLGRLPIMGKILLSQFVNKDVCL